MLFLLSSCLCGRFCSVVVDQDFNAIADTFIISVLPDNVDGATEKLRHSRDQQLRTKAKQRWSNYCSVEAIETPLNSPTILQTGTLVALSLRYQYILSAGNRSLASSG